MNNIFRRCERKLDFDEKTEGDIPRENCPRAPMFYNDDDKVPGRPSACKTVYADSERFLPALAVTDCDTTGEGGTRRLVDHR
jgi:hypothetical protein